MPLSSLQLDHAGGVLLGQVIAEALTHVDELPHSPVAPAIAAALDGTEVGEWSVGCRCAVSLARACVEADELPTADELLAALDREECRGEWAHLALLRTSPLGLARLGDREATADLVRAVAAGAGDEWAQDACVLWCEAIRRAVLDHVLALSPGLDLLPPERQDTWRATIGAAERGRATAAGDTAPTTAQEVVAAAWAAIQGATGLEPFAQHLGTALESGDTETVPALAGALLGARYGVSRLPHGVARKVHGWPGTSAMELVDLAQRLANNGQDVINGAVADPDEIEDEVPAVQA